MVADALHQYKSPASPGSTLIGRVDHVWEAFQSVNQIEILLLCITEYKLGRINPYYNMQEIVRSTNKKFIRTEVCLKRTGKLK